MKNVVIVCLALLGIAAALTIDVNARSFVEFQRKFNRVYQTQDEFDKRFQIFKNNLNRAAELQRKEKDGGARFGITKFMDLTEQEFASFFRMPNVNFTQMKTAPVKTQFKTISGATPNPTNWDWCANAGACTPVYNQGQCGSCWAFSVVETIESYYVLGGHTLTQFSMEEIVDCDTQDDGCNGGFPTTAYEYIQQCGLEPYSAYPYSSGGSCQYNAADVVVGVSGYQSLTGETGLYSQLSTAGPVSVCVDASSWQFYNGGVLTSCGTSVDHCVELTGYGNYGQSGAYWNVRNSWGADWGENGFIEIAIGQDLCDIADYATVPEVSAPPQSPPSTCSQ